MLEISKDQQFRITWPQPVDDQGNPAPVQDGSVVHSTSDPNKATAHPDPTNPFSVIIKGQNPSASVFAIIVADADVGAGVAPITDRFEFAVLSGQAIGFGAPAIGAVEAKT